MPFLIVLLAAIVILIATLPIWLIYPPVSPDEPVYAEISANIIKEGHPSLEMWGNLLPHVRQNVYFYPPAFFYLLAGWFKVFSINIATQRALSAALGLAFAGIFYLLIKKLLLISFPLTKLAAGWLAALSTIILLLDFNFWRASRLSRPEILILFLSAGCFYLITHLSNTQKFRFTSQKNAGWWALIAGFLAAGAALSHYIGLWVFVAGWLYILIANFHRKHYFQPLIFYSLGFILPVAAWLLPAISNWSSFSVQFLSHLELNTRRAAWFFSLSMDSPLAPPLQIIVFIYALVTLAVIVQAIIQRNQAAILFAVCLTIIWLAIWRPLYLYFTLLSPWVAGSIAALIAAGLSYRPRRPAQEIFRSAFLAVIVCSSLVYITISAGYLFLLTQFWLNSDWHYQEFSQKVVDAIPAGSSVMVAAEPDPTYGLWEKGYPVLGQTIVQTDPSQDITHLDNADYLVYDDRSHIFLKLTMIKYLDLNTETVSETDPSRGYPPAYVIKLKRRDQRINPLIK